MTRPRSLPNKRRAERVITHKISGRSSLFISSDNAWVRTLPACLLGERRPSSQCIHFARRHAGSVRTQERFSFLSEHRSRQERLFPSQLLSFGQIDHDVPVEADEFVQRFF